LSVAPKVWVEAYFGASTSPLRGYAQRER